MGSLRARPLRLLGAVALLAFAGADVAAAADRVQVVPSRLEATAGRGEELPPIRVFNRGSAPIVVRAVAVPARQDVTGLPVYDFSAESRRRGRAMFALGRKRLEIPPGQSRSTQVSMVGCPRAGVGSYGVVGFAARRRGARPGQVTPVVRLSSTLLVRSPGGPCLEGEVSGLEGEQRGDRLAFVSRVRNVGNIHGKPRVRVSIMRGDRALDRVYAARENVIPGAERQFETVLPGTLPAGTYVAQADVWMGFRHTVRRWRFRLTGPNRLPTTKLRLTDLRMGEASPGEPSEAKVAVANRGDARGGAQLRVKVASGGRTLEQKIVEVAALDGGDARTVAVPVSALPAGAYDLRVELLRDGARADVRATSFAVRGAPGLLTRVLDWLAAHVLLVIGGLLTLFVLVLGWVARRRRPPAAPVRAPEPPAADPGDAGLDEIAELRAALERLEDRRSRVS